VLPPTITPTRPYPCDPRLHATGRERRGHLAASVARRVAAAIRGSRVRHALRRLMALGDQLLRDLDDGRDENEHVAQDGRGP
jgi:hypothetical protein